LNSNDNSVYQISTKGQKIEKYRDTFNGSNLERTPLTVKDFQTIGPVQRITSTLGDFFAASNVNDGASNGVVYLFYKDQLI